MQCNEDMLSLIIFIDMSLASNFNFLLFTPLKVFHYVYKATLNDYSGIYLCCRNYFAFISRDSGKLNCHVFVENEVSTVIEELVKIICFT